MSDYTDGYKAGLQAAADFCRSKAMTPTCVNKEYMMGTASGIAALPVPDAPQRKPLTDEQIKGAVEAYTATNIERELFFEGVRWAEKQHGIGTGEEADHG